MAQWPTFIFEEDLAPGDRVPHPCLPEELRLQTIESTEDPNFELAFTLLNDQFASLREMETREVIEARLGWKGQAIRDEKHMLYHLMALFHGETCGGIRDHTAIVNPKGGPVIGHLSHVLVVPEWRRRGLVTLLRTMPVSTARALAQIVNRPDAPITLFCEMDPLDMEDPANRIRRLSYEKANFAGLPSGQGYLQPDFREEQLIKNDPKGTQPVALDLLFRFVGDEGRQRLDSAELIEAINHVYCMYSAGLSDREMAPCRAWFETFKATVAPTYPLFPPTKTK